MQAVTLSYILSKISTVFRFSLYNSMRVRHTFKKQFLELKKLMIHHPKFNMEPKTEGLVQMMFLFIWVIFRFHVNFPGCNHGSFWNKHRLQVLHHCGYMVYALWTKPCHVCLGEILSIPFHIGSMYGTYFFYIYHKQWPKCRYIIYHNDMDPQGSWELGNKKTPFHFGRPQVIHPIIQSIQVIDKLYLLESKCSTTKSHHQDLFQPNPLTCH